MNARISEIRQQFEKNTETAVLIQEVKTISQALDELLLSTREHSARLFTLWGEQVILLRRSGLAYELYTISNGVKWNSIPELATEAAEYAFYNGYIQ